MIVSRTLGHNPSGRILFDGFDAIRIDAHKAASLDIRHDPRPPATEPRLQISHAHVAQPDVDDAGRRMPRHRQIGEIAVLGHNDQIIGPCVTPDLRVFPSLVDVVDISAVVFSPEIQPIRQIDVDQKPRHADPYVDLMT